jgi:alkylation response protein AidB-like acyl-CoA dehydrogenase
MGTARPAAADDVSGGVLARVSRGKGSCVSHYKSNLRDIEFNLFEVFANHQPLGSQPFQEVDRDTAREILHEVDRVAREQLAEVFTSADRTPPTFDPVTHSVAMPADFKATFGAFMDAEWWRLELPAELGGQPVPPSLRWSLAELVLGANPAMHLYAGGPAFASVVYRNGTERDRSIARHMIARRWGATMVLTEPDAGSDVGAGRTRAIAQPDGTWHIEGTKRFITSAEHDLAENIVHLVLARPIGVHGAGGPGTKGLSLFIVPKHRFDLDTGELTGERNGVFATAVEHKMGIKASTTCELTFGETEPAVGWLLGDVHDGIAQMFQIIENARMMVGTKAMATLSTGYLNALEYAKGRVQGPDLVQAGDKTAQRVPITRHPDVRRSLLTQKSNAEALRALVVYTATFQDRVLLASAQGREDAEAAAMNDLLLPIVKGYCSERAWAVLATESLQTFGGSGFLEDYPLEQYVRDAKIDTLYEGTTAIQGLDLFFRKIVKNRGAALQALAAEIGELVSSEAGNGRLKVERRLLAQAVEDVQAIVAAMAGALTSSDPRVPGGDVRNVYKAGLNATRLLMALGDIVCGYLLLRQADVALRALSGELQEREQRFYEGKVASAQFFAQTVLPRVSAERAVAEATDLLAMDVEESAF